MDPSLPDRGRNLRRVSPPPVDGDNGLSNLTGPGREEISRELLARLPQLTTLWASIRDHDWSRVRRSLRDLGTELAIQPHLRAILHQPLPGTDRPLLHALASEGAPARVLQETFRIGAGVTREREVSGSETAGARFVLARTELHDALAGRHFDSALALLQAGSTRRAISPCGDAPLHTLLRAAKGGSLRRHQSKALDQTVTQLLTAPETVDLRGDGGKLPLVLAIESKLWNSAESICNIHLRNGKAAVTRDELLLCELKVFASLGPLSIIDRLQSAWPTATAQRAPGSALPEGWRTLLLEAAPEMPGSDWSKLRALVRHLTEQREFFPAPVLTELLEARSERDERTLAQRVLSNDGPIELLSEVLSLGADPNARFTIYCKEDSVPECTMLHAAMLAEDKILGNVLIEAGADRHAQNARGDTPLLFYLKEAPILDKDFLLSAVRANPKTDVTDNEGLGVPHILLQRKELDLLVECLNSGLEPPPGARGLRYQVQAIGEPVLVDYRTMTTLLADEAGTLSEECAKELFELLSTGKDPYDGYLYVKAYNEALEPEEYPVGESLVRLARSYLTRYEPGQLMELVAAIEGRNDHVFYNDHRVPGKHPALPEMLLFLNHPKLPSLAPDHVNFLTRGITSVSRFLDMDVPLNDPTAIVNMRRAGYHTHSFLHYRFDCQQIREYDRERGWQVINPALVEEFGFFRVPARANDSGSPDTPQMLSFGAGYVLPQGVLDGETGRGYRAGRRTEASYHPDTWLEIRQGYYAVSNPVLGTLLVGNSSPKFGRGNFVQPVLYSTRGVDNGFSKKDLLALDQNAIERWFRPLLELELHGYREHTHAPNTSRQPEIEELFNQLEVALDAYRRWKFDTSAKAFDSSAGGKPKLIGGWNSPGFRHVVERLEYWHNQGTLDSLFNPEGPATAVPALGFCHPSLPPWRPYRFQDETGTVRDRLPMTEERVAVLRRLVDGTATKRQVERCGLQRFFQDAGMKNHGVLTLLPSRDE